MRRARKVFALLWALCCLLLANKSLADEVKIGLVYSANNPGRHWGHSEGRATNGLRVLADAALAWTDREVWAADSCAFDDEALSELSCAFSQVMRSDFDLSEDEASSLGRYLTAGGFLFLESQTETHTTALELVEQALTSVGAAYDIRPLPHSHPLYHEPYALAQIPPVIGGFVWGFATWELDGVHVNGRLVAVISRNAYFCCWGDWGHRDPSIGDVYRGLDNTLQLLLGINVIHLALSQQGTGGVAAQVHPLQGGVYQWEHIGLAGETVTCIAVDPQDRRIMYAGTARNGLFRTVDSGGTWVAANQGLTPLVPDEPLSVSSLTIDAANPSVLYAIVSSRVFKTTTGGAYWQEPDGPWDSTIPLVMHPDSSSVLYFCQAEHIWRTADGGDTRQRWSSVLYVEGAEYVPHALGRGWVPSGEDPYTGEGGGVTGSVTGLAIDRLHPRTMYASADSGIFKSQDTGRTWHKLASLDWVPSGRLLVDPVCSSTIYARAWSGIHLSRDGGSTWSHMGLTHGGSGEIAVSPTDPHTVYLATPLGVFANVSSDTSWRAVGPFSACGSGEPTCMSVEAIAFDPEDASILYAGTSRPGATYLANVGGVYKASVSGIATAVDASIADRRGLPSRFRLVHIYPNPFNPSALVTYEVPGRMQVTVCIYNTLGQKVALLVDATKAVGTHTVAWDGSNARGRPCASGVYVCRLKSGPHAAQQRFTLLR